MVEKKDKFRVRLRGYFITGLITFLPLLVTYFILLVLYRLLEYWVGPLGKTALQYIMAPGLFDILLKYQVMTILGLVLAVIILVFVGYLSTNIFGKRFFEWLESLITHIPVMGNIYHAAKQMAETIGSGKKSFRAVVLIEYPRKGNYSLGFVTRDSVIPAGEGAKKVLHVFVPTNQLYLGYTVFCEAPEVTPLELSVEDGIKLVMSGGIVSPDVFSKKNTPF